MHPLSNHPPQIFRQLPFLLTRETAFESTKLEFQGALRKSSYESTLNYKLKNTLGKKTEADVEILYGSIHLLTKIFFHLVDKHFPKSNRLHKIFNRNTVKVSYSCMENISQIIKRHNEQVTKTNKRSIAPCNCRVESVRLKMYCTNALSLAQKNQRNMFTLALLTTITPCHSEIRNTKMTQPFQLFYENLRYQQKKFLSLHGQF